MNLIRLTLLALVCLLPTAFIQARPLGFTVTFQGVESDLAIMSASIMPGQVLRLKTVAKITSAGGNLTQSGLEWRWTAPMTPGHHELLLSHNNETMLLHVFVLTPYKNNQQTSLNGFRIGRYENVLFRGLSAYAPPQGFIDVAHGPADLQISPHFTLGQFLCKQQPGHDPSYLLVQPALLVKLETLLEAANQRGWKADTFFIMSGFRTPDYNRAINNDTSSSRHLYGDAADIWIDHDGDGQMDDLNRDGKVNKADAEALAALADSLAKKGGRGWPVGGIGIYAANAAHGPFVHIDARGYRARW